MLRGWASTVLRMYVFARAAAASQLTTAAARGQYQGVFPCFGVQVPVWGVPSIIRGQVYYSPARLGKIRISNTALCVCPRTAMAFIIITNAVHDAQCTRSAAPCQPAPSAQPPAPSPPAPHFASNRHPHVYTRAARGSHKNTKQVMQPKTGTITEPRHDESEAQRNHLDLSDPTVYPSTPSGQGLALHPVAPQPDWLLIVYRRTRRYTLAASSPLAWL